MEHRPGRPLGGLPAHLAAQAMGGRRSPTAMSKKRAEHVWASLLWGSVAAIGQHTMLFLTIIRRIHVRFPNNAPTFAVDPYGPIVLTKDAALTSVWVLSLAYGVIVALLMYFRPCLRRTARVLFAVVGVVLAGLSSLADPWWGLVVLADCAVLYGLLSREPELTPLP
jgi:hypothetical protein